MMMWMRRACASSIRLLVLFLLLCKQLLAVVVVLLVSLGIQSVRNLHAVCIVQREERFVLMLSDLNHILGRKLLLCALP